MATLIRDRKVDRKISKKVICLSVLPVNGGTCQCSAISAAISATQQIRFCSGQMLEKEQAATGASRLYDKPRISSAYSFLALSFCA
jgi:hypothetical protein